MYKILIKFDNKVKNNLWEVYGSSTISTTGSTTSTEFETDDVAVLKEELIKLDKIVGYENIRVVEDKTFIFSVDVVTDEVVNDTTTPDIPSEDEENTGI